MRIHTRKLGSFQPLAGVALVIAGHGAFGPAHPPLAPVDGLWTIVIILAVIAVLAASGAYVWFARSRRELEPEEETPGEMPVSLPESLPETPAAPAQVSAPEAPVAVQPVPEVETPPPPAQEQATPPPVIEQVPERVPIQPPLPTGLETPSHGIPVPAVPQFLEGRTTVGQMKRFPLNGGILTIGRAADNQIMIGDEFAAAGSVADYHARVRLRDQWVTVEAASSSNPLYVNGERTGRNILRNGWRLTLGELNLIFRTAGIGTAPLAEVESAALAPDEYPPERPGTAGLVPLPDGALLGDRYVVIEGSHDSPTLNVYIAESLHPVLRCAQCGFDANGPERKSCQNCGATLAGSASFYPHYLIKESSDKDAFSAEQQLIGLGHPSALLPRETFAEVPYSDTIRYYLVLPEPPPQLAARVRIPQEMPQVLEWTLQLAQGMAYLHNNSVALGPIDLWRIALDGQQAYWVDFSPCEFVAEEERPRRFAHEVNALAEVSYYLLTGKRKYDEFTPLAPPGVGMVYDRALGGPETETATQLATALQAALVEVRRPSSLDVRVGRLSDVGQLRQINEDSILTVEIGRVRRSISEPLGLYVVCDGMGGQSAGDVASGLAVQALVRKALEVMSDGIADGPPPKWETWLKTAIQEANQTVFGNRRASGNDMGTTCVAALVSRDTVVVGNAGDSRCYLLNERGIRQVTTDHSLVQRLIELGQLTPAEARTHPQRNVIYKNLGDKPTVEPDIVKERLSPGDRLLLCSDGLTGMVEDEQVWRIVMASCSPQEACCALIEAANKAGGEDNISAILVQVDGLD